MKKTISISIFAAALVASSFTNCSEARKTYRQQQIIEGEYKATEAKDKIRNKNANANRINEITKNLPSGASYFAELKRQRELEEAQRVQYSIAHQANTKKTSKK
jgi:hypothetical protein